jgi:hypothetical protein
MSAPVCMGMRPRFSGFVGGRHADGLEPPPAKELDTGKRELENFVGRVDEGFPCERLHRSVISLRGFFDQGELCGSEPERDRFHGRF